MYKGSFRILRTKEVLEILGVSKTTLYDMIEEGRFPRPSRISKRAVGWPSPVIDAFVESLPPATGAKWR